ncbi:DUF2508 family protein [Paenibacillus alkalitolerans]|uniref:DUF2508 family protein n=1 Tax=Paenibacillus alkalitolerans TaxID=2799335 RepID=UPI0018F3FD3F|nr:DUF2508 family protein [Paenibacillus alkalitolerans]
MKWLSRLLQRMPKRREQEKILEAESEMIAEVRQAHMEWLCAQQRLDYALDWDQIDYAVYALEAAEKRYSMLLRQAKAMKAKAKSMNAAYYYTLRIQ